MPPPRSPFLPPRPVAPALERIVALAGDVLGAAARILLADGHSAAHAPAGARAAASDAERLAPGLLAALQRGEGVLPDGHGAGGDAASRPFLAARVGPAERAAGVLVVTDDASRVWTESERHALEALAGFAAEQLDRAAGRERAGTIAEEQAALRRVATLVAAGGDPHAVFAAVAEEAARLLDADRGGVCRFNDGDSLTVVAGYDPQTADLALPVGTVLPREPGGLSKRIEDAGCAQRHELPPTHALGRQAFRTMVAAPIRVADRTWGFVSVSTREQPLEAEAESRLDGFAELVGMAVANAEAREELSRLALHDPLTGVPNRTLLTQRLSLVLARAASDDERVAVLFLDFDHFKKINDSYGHARGDELLREVAGRLVAAAGDRATVARVSGDEFVILLPAVADGEAVAVARRVTAAFDEAFRLAGDEIFVTASVGLAYADGRRSAAGLVSDADAAMYRAKSRGRNRFEVFDETMRASSAERLRLEADLRRAIPRRELDLRYQPLVALSDGRVAGFEVLLRWQHPERGLLAPDAFIPIAEETGLIRPIGHVVLDGAIRQAAEWLRTGTPLPPLGVAVNVSARQLHDPEFVTRVAALLRRHGLRPELLGLEITETVLMEDSDGALRTLAELRALGVRLILDDFGTGYSSLAYIQRFPLDRLKLDRSFTQALTPGSPTGEIVAAITRMAAALGVAVVAEGVETSEQREHLRALGCAFAQGFLFTPPLDAEAAAALIAPAVPRAA
jgi:diguanylate cyclase (GGDEF)-like protein